MKAAKKINKELEVLVLTFFSESQAEKILAAIPVRSKPSAHIQMPKLKSTERKQLEFDFDESVDTNSQIEYLRTAADKIPVSENLFQFLLRLGQYSNYSGEYSIAVEIFEEIITETQKVNEFRSINAAALLAIGEIFSRQAKWQPSFDYIKKALAAYKKLNDLHGCAKCENLLGTVYGDMGNIDKASEHFIKSLSYLDNGASDLLKAKVEVNLGIMNNIQENYDVALAYFKRALRKFEKVSDLIRIAEIKHNIGMTFLKKNELQTALNEFDSAIQISTEHGFLQILNMSYLSKAFIYVKLNQLDLAEAFANKSLKLSYKINDKLSIADVYKIKGMIQRAFNNFNQSESYYLTSLRMNKDLKNELNEAETSYELGILYGEINRSKESQLHLKRALNYYKGIKAYNEVINIQTKLQD
jgi:tetratricopeptide (TPR) repeat protein